VRKAHDLDAAPASSMRSMKRVTKIPGSFLSGPARRGKRRQSEEDAENAAAAEVEAEAEAASSQERESQQAEGGHDYQPHNFYLSSYRDLAATERGSPVSAKDPARLAVRRQSPPVRGAGEQRNSMLEAAKSHLDLPAYKGPAPPPAAVNVPSGHDKENEIPIPPFKSSINSQVPLMSVLEKEQNKPVRPLHVDQGERGRQAPVHASPDRKALAPKSQNQPTPRRIAPPPPPKMSVVETATKAAGAGVTSKKRAVLMRVNDRVYTRIECVGRGGSGKVYRVSAENGSMYALKRVSIEHADEHTVKGFKGEIDLLKRLTGVERVIQLYDWEMNEEKQMLSLVRPLYLFPILKWT
jgi:serine/threonine-protein kinase TTK/MPS1